MNVYEILNHIFPFSMGFLGLLIGSFLNVVITRLPNGLLMLPGAKSFFWPSSHCPNCEQAIQYYDNIPILSYCWLKGRCRQCQCAISFQYPLVEFLTAVLSFCVALRYGISITTFTGLLLIWSLIVLSFIDIKYFILPDLITIPVLWFGLFLSIFSIYQNCSAAILGAILGYFTLWAVYWIFKVVTGKEGMGFGDFKLLAMLGAWFGWQALPFIILLSSFIGVMVGIFLIMIKKHQRNQPLPFGPFLAIGGSVVFFFNRDLMSLYSWMLKL